MGTGYNVVYQRFQILVVQSAHGVEMYVERNINYGLLNGRIQSYLMLKTSHRFANLTGGSGVRASL
jgi:hypothetical protein